MKLCEAMADAFVAEGETDIFGLTPSLVNSKHRLHLRG
jgi:hypothetical protein